MKRLQSPSLSNLPSDLLEDILSRVPATSFKGVSSTCKQWNAFSKDPRFIKKHFDTAAKQYVALVKIDGTFSSLSVNLRGLHDNIDPSIELEDEVILTEFNHPSIEPEDEVTLTDFNHPSIELEDEVILTGFNHISHVFHCDGLLLCTDKSTNTSTRLVVWNPCTGQTRWIQTKLVNRYTTYALGYESNKLCRNYKIMRFVNDETLSELEIYEFNSNSWRALDHVISDSMMMIKVDGVSLKGNTYWIGMDMLEEEEEEEEEVYGDDYLMMFDFTTERFGERMALPHKGNFGYTHAYKSLSSVRDERLAMLFEYKDTSTMEIWMTNDISKTKAMSWSIFVKIGLNTIGSFCDASFFLDEENKVAVCFDTTIVGKTWDDDDILNNIVHIIGEDGWRRVNLGRPECCWTCMFSYVPSLVQI